MRRDMEPIDVLEMKHKMEEDCTVKKFLQRPGNVCNSLTMATFQAASLTTNNVPFDLFCFLISGYNLYRLFAKWEMYKDIYTRIAMRLEHTAVYSRMSENYFTFIHEFAVLLKKLGIKDTKELLCLTELLMKKGYFSYNFDHKYCKYKYETGEMSGTTGAHVTTGKCVCRHMASFVSDLLYHFNVEGCNIEVRVKYEDEVKDFLKFGKKKEYNHAVVGIIDGDSKYIFDPTNDVFAGKSDKKFKRTKSKDVAQTTIKEKKAYIFKSAKSMWLNKLHLDEYKKYNQMDLGEVDFEEIEKIRIKVEEFYNANKGEFDAFYKKMKHLLEEVNRDIKMLSPKSDEEIKEWVLKY